MKASNTDHERTNPVALRRNSVDVLTGLSFACAWGSEAARYGVSLPTVIVFVWARLLSSRQGVAADSLLWVQVNHHALQHPLLVQAAGVNCQGLAQARGALGFMNVPVQRQQRLIFQNGIA